MTTPTADRADVRIPPPLVFFALLACGIILELVFPSRFMNVPQAAKIVVSVLLFAASGLFAGGSFIALAKNKTPFDPARPTIKIVRDYSFRYSRNPMYLSLVVLLAGVAVIMTSIWLLAAIPILFILFHYFAVLPEEKYLENKFGPEYTQYASSVRRWI